MKFDEIGLLSGRWIFLWHKCEFQATAYFSVLVNFISTGLALLVVLTLFSCIIHLHFILHLKLF